LRSEKTCCKTPEVVQLLTVLCRSISARKVVELDAHLGCVTLGLALNGITDDHGIIWTWDQNEELINKLKEKLKEANVENKVKSKNASLS
jgi:predicted O-methyltransferase YrrM